MVQPVVDAAGRNYAVHAGHEDNPNFMAEVHDPAVAAMEDAIAKSSVSMERTFHRRGNFPSIPFGQSRGPGQDGPATLLNSVTNTLVLWSFLSNSAYIRLAGYASAVFANYAPHVYAYYVLHMRQLYRRHPSFRRPFINSIWSACTFNLGPRVCTLGHRDHANLSFGWSAITALGTYNYRKGGHLILWDCKLILEFPPGTTIFIPSAIIYHSNIPVSTSETRYSFAQYTAGGLFRWVQHGFRSEEAFWASLSTAETKVEKQKDAERWDDGVHLFSYEDELA
ncbi:hypothetical protein B0H13DRAFT_1588193 [Mycena leptocephala]|nr:hypothetical protein B0H13DRAFT_1588193 [Mycena leptocephala]